MSTSSLLRFLFLLILSPLVPGSAQPANFNFSYTFNSGTIISGTLDGTQTGSLIENVTNMTFSINGTFVSGFTAVSHFDVSARAWVQGSPVLSTDVFQNNFLLDGDTGTFYIIGKDHNLIDDSGTLINNAFSSQSAQQVVTGSWNEVLETGNWSIAPASAIPEPSTYAAIFGLIALGLVTYRRRG